MSHLIQRYLSFLCNYLWNQFHSEKCFKVNPAKNSELFLQQTCYGKRVLKQLNIKFPWIHARIFRVFLFLRVQVHGVNWAWTLVYARCVRTGMRVCATEKVTSLQNLWNSVDSARLDFTQSCTAQSGAMRLKSSLDSLILQSCPVSAHFHDSINP